jgi:MFS transporter, DHA1 family, multidrug resistance protein
VSRAERVALTLMLGGMAALMPFAIDITLPAMPALARDLGVTTTAAQMTLSAFILGVGSGQLIHGPLSDHFGRRPVLLSGLVLAVAASLGAMTAGSLPVLLGFRFVQGFAVCACQVLTRAVVRDRFEREAAASALSYIMLVGGLAPVLAPIFGAWLSVRFGWQAIFAFLALFSAALTVAVWRWLDESLPAARRQPLRPRRLAMNLPIIIRDRTFGASLAIALFTGIGLFAFLTASPGVLIDFMGETPAGYGYAFATIMIGAVVTQLFAARLVMRLGIDRLLLVGVLLTSGSGVTMAALGWAGVAGLAAIVVPMFFFAAGIALTFPQTIARALTPFPHVAGAASSLFGFLQLLAAAGASALLGLVDDGTQIPMVSTIGLAGIGALLSYVFLFRRAPG